MQEKESPIISVCSLIICCNLNEEVMPSILESSYVKKVQQLKTRVKKILLAVAVSIFNSKLFNHLAIVLANDIKIQIYIIHLLFLS